MAIRGLRETVLEVNFSVHGAPAQVTPPEGLPVNTRVIALTAFTEQIPVGNDFRRVEHRRTFAIKRKDVPVVPVGTQIEMAEHEGDPPRTWNVDSVVLDAPDHIRVLVVPA